MFLFLGFFPSQYMLNTTYLHFLHGIIPAVCPYVIASWRKKQTNNIKIVLPNLSFNQFLNCLFFYEGNHRKEHSEFQWFHWATLRDANLTNAVADAVHDLLHG